MDSYLEAALEEVTEVIMSFGQWPQPPSRRDMHVLKQFDLVDFVRDHIELVELAEFFVLAMTDHSNSGEFVDQRTKFGKKLQAMLEKDAAVLEIAQGLADQRRADDEETNDDATNDPRRGQAAAINKERP